MGRSRKKPGPFKGVPERKKPKDVLRGLDTQHRQFSQKQLTKEMDAFFARQRDASTRVSAKPSSRTAKRLH